MRSLKNKAFIFLALLSVLRAVNSPQVTDVFIDPYTNGLLYTLYSEEKINIDNVSSWMSPHGWCYITVNGATFSLEIPGKIPALNQIKDIVIKNNHESGQIAFLLSKPVNDIQILKSEISNAFQISAVYKLNKAIKQRLGEEVNNKKSENYKFEERSRPLARKKLQDSINREPSITYMNLGFSPDSLNSAVDKMINDLVFDLADVDAFKKNKAIQNETEFIRMHEGVENRNNEPNIMNDFVKMGDLVVNDPATTYIKELFSPKKSWYEDDFFQPKESSLEKGQLKITSTIDDITIFIDDEYVGLTPISDNIELTVGSHKVWCIPPVPINNSRWYESPISENVIGDAIHNVFIQSNEVTIVDFDLYVLNTSPNYKENFIYQDSLGAILGLGDIKSQSDKNMKRFLNRRIKSLKSSSSKKGLSKNINVLNDKKSKQILNGPPPLATSKIHKENKQLVPKLLQKIPEEEHEEDRKIAIVFTKEIIVSEDSSISNALIDESKNSQTDSSNNLFNRLFSSFRKNGQNTDSDKQDSIKELIANTIPNKDALREDDYMIAIKNEDDNQISIPKSDIDNKVLSLNKTKIEKPQLRTIQSITNTSYSDLDVIRIVNAEYVNTKERRPDNINYSFPSSNHRVYCFTVVKNLNKPVRMSHYWYKNGNFMARIPMEVGFSSAWRCWSYITLREGFEGDWKVVARGPNNEQLEEISFTIFSNKDLAKQKK